MTDNKLYYAIKLSKSGIDNNYRHNNTNSILDYLLPTYKKSMCIKDTELFEGIKNGKIAVFPRYVKQDMETVKNFSDMGFEIYLLMYRDFQDFKKRYIKKCIEVETVEDEGKQLELGL